MKRALLVVVALFAVAAVLWSLLDRAAAPPASTAGSGTTTAEGAEAMRLQGAAPAAAASARQAVPPSATEAAAPAAPAEASATIRGRCVDAAGRVPLAGCSVSLRGWEANDQRMAAYGREVTWQDPPAQTTGADGTFAFTFAPPPPYQFMLRIERPSCVTLVGRWGEIAPGTTKDLGDVRMSLGSLVSGRIVDTAGAPQANVDLQLSEVPHAAARTLEMRPYVHARERTAADGTFTCAAPFAPGRYELRLRQRQLVEPEHVTIPEGGAPVFVEVRVRALADVPAIEGIVVDESGAPVARAQIERDPPLSGINFGISTERDGSFRVERRPDEDSAGVRITARRDGYEDAKSDGVVPWGTKDLRLLARRTPGVELLVLEGDGEQPVEEYGVRCWLDATVTGRWGGDSRLRQRGKHEGGLLVLRNLQRGPTWLCVEPVTDRLHPSPFLRFVVGDGGAPRQVVRLYPPAERLLQVVRADGAPVAGTKVELLQPLDDEPVDLRSHVVERSRIDDFQGAHKVLLLHAGVTDAAGELLLRGPRPHPGAPPLALRLLGPGHAPFVVSPVSLYPDVAPLRVEVPTGAVLRGTLTPARLLAQLRPANLPEGADPAQWHPGLKLRAVSPDLVRTTLPPGAWERFSVGEDGRFEVTGIPAGTWDVLLEHTQAFGEFGHGTSSTCLLADVVLREGEAREVALDASALLRGTVEGRVTWNGAPAGGAFVTLSSTQGDPAGRNVPVMVQNLTVAADGTFTAQAQSGVYRALVQLPRPENARAGDRPVRVPAGDPIHVVPDRTVQAALDVKIGGARLRLLGADGKTPASGVAVQIEIEGIEGWGVQAKSDGDGMATFANLPPMPLQVAVWPKRLATLQAQSEYMSSVRGNWRRVLVPVGTVTPIAGQAAAEPTVFTLPAAAGY